MFWRVPNFGTKGKNASRVRTCLALEDSPNVIKLRFLTILWEWIDFRFGAFVVRCEPRSHFKFSEPRTEHCSESNPNLYKVTANSRYGLVNLIWGKTEFIELKPLMNLFIKCWGKQSRNKSPSLRGAQVVLNVYSRTCWEELHGQEEDEKLLPENYVNLCKISLFQAVPHNRVHLQVVLQWDKDW